MESLPPMFRAASLTTEYLLQGSIMEQSREVLLQRLIGLCDDTKSPPDNFHDHEMVFHMKNNTIQQPLVFRVRHSLVQSDCWSLRYLGNTEMGDKNKPTLTRTSIDCPVSDNVVQYLNELGFRMDHEYVVKGYYFHKGRMKVTVSKFFKMNQPSNVADNLEAVCPSFLVELSVVTALGQEGVGEDMKNFAEQLKPLVQLEKTDHRKITMNQT